jgi:hypothetical protein
MHSIIRIVTKHNLISQAAVYLGSLLSIPSDLTLVIVQSKVF